MLYARRYFSIEMKVICTKKSVFSELAIKLTNRLPCLFMHRLLLLFTFFLTGCSTPYIFTPVNHEASPALEVTTVEMSDHFRLPMTVWQTNEKSHAVILALHGMNDYRKAFENMGRYLSQRGITLYAYDQRGFGETDGAGYWHGHNSLVNDLHALTELLRQKHPDLPLYVLGESMGGAVVLAAQLQFTLNVDGYILVAPAIWSRDNMPFYQRLLLWIAAHTIPAKRLTGEGLEIKPTDNREMLRALARDPLVIKATRVDVLYGVTNLMDAALAAARVLRGDILVLYGKNDEIIPKPPTCQLLSRLSINRHVRLFTQVYDKGYHMLTRDLNADIVLNDIETWILGEYRPHSNHFDFCLSLENKSHF